MKISADKLNFKLSNAGNLTAVFAHTLPAVAAVLDANNNVVQAAQAERTIYVNTTIKGCNLNDSAKISSITVQPELQSLDLQRADGSTSKYYSMQFIGLQILSDNAEKKALGHKDYASATSDHSALAIKF